jgi:hypothetical protein
MIWQLMKRDWAWRMTPWAAVLCAIFARGGWAYSALFFLAMVSWNDPGFLSNCNVYEAALPIEARALWLSRIASRLALLWLPVLAATAALALRGDHLPYLLAGAGVWTVVVLVVKRFRIREFSVPRWVRFCAIIVPFAVFGPVGPSLDAFGGPASARVVLAICGVVGAALFLSGWFAVPKTFQSALVRPTGWGLRERGRSRFVWSPVFRSIFRRPMWFTLFLLLSQLSIGSVFVPFVFLPVFLTMTRASQRWLSPLPVASRTLFRLTLAPLAGAIVVAAVIRVFVDREHPIAPRTRIVELAVELGILCLLLWLGELIDWFGLSRFKPSVRGIPLAVGMVLLLIPMVVGALSLNRLRAASPLIAANSWQTFDGALRLLATALPENGLLLALTLTAPLAALYWLTEKTYAEMEYPRVRATEPLK